MKIKVTLQLILIIAIFSKCTQTKSTEDPEKFKKIMTSYFEGIENKDFEKLKSLTTNDFVLYEDGSIWNNDSAFNNIKRHIPFTVKYKLDSFNIYIDKMSADMHYLNHADFIFKDSSKESLDWVESATLRKTESGWKINFLHLTVRR